MRRVGTMMGVLALLVACDSMVELGRFTNGGEDGSPSGPSESTGEEAQEAGASDAAATPAGAVCVGRGAGACNDAPSVSAKWGTCQPDDTCLCNPGFAVNPSTGRCTPKCPPQGSSCGTTPDLSKKPVISCLSPVAQVSNTPFKLDIYGDYLSGPSGPGKVLVDGVSYGAKAIDNCHIEVSLPAMRMPGWISVVAYPQLQSDPAYLEIYDPFATRPVPGFPCGTQTCSENEFCEVVTSDVPEFDGGFVRERCRNLGTCYLNDICTCALGIGCDYSGVKFEGTCSYSGAGGSAPRLSCGIGG